MATTESRFVMHIAGIKLAMQYCKYGETSRQEVNDVQFEVCLLSDNLRELF